MAEERVQRRLAAIVCADVVGYSTMMGRDEAGTLARLKALRADFLYPKVEEYGGRIVKTTGDGTLIEFPSAVDAVQHAIDVQRGLTERNADLPEDRRIQLRLGINLGEIIIDGDDIYGDGVNVAARLEALAEAGGVCMSSDVYRQVGGKLDAVFDDLGEQTLKNIQHPVQIYSVNTALPTLSQVPLRGVSQSLPGRPSIAVLPFENISGDPEQEYFADGIAEDIITALSRFRSFFVIARNSSFIYKGKAVDVRQVGRELGVRYVLEGSVRKGANRLRITAQLVEAETGNHLWAEKYDGALEDVFDLQDSITEGVVGAIEPSIRRAELERARRKRPDNLKAYDLYLRAQAHFWSFVQEEWTKAIALLDEALRLQPDYVEAHALASIVHFVFNNARVSGHLGPAISHARWVLSSDCDDAYAYAAAGFTLAATSEDFEAGRTALEKALALNPNSVMTLSCNAAVNSWIGRFDEAVEQAQRAIRLNPFDPGGFIPRVALSRAHYLSGRYAEAAEAAAQAIQATPNSVWSYLWLAASYVRLGRIDEAQAVGRQLLELNPQFQYSKWPGMLNSPQEHRDLVFPALAKAGLPE